MAAEAKKVSRGEKVKGRYLTYFLSQTGLPMKTVYSNVTELLLAGVDTVGTSLRYLITQKSRAQLDAAVSLYQDLQHFVLVAV